MNKTSDFSKKAGRLEFSRAVAEEGIVLLKNDNNLLPLKEKKLAIFGASQLNEQIANEGVKIDTENSKGITEAILQKGFKIDEHLYKSYIVWKKKYVQRAYGEWLNAHFWPEMDITHEMVIDTRNRGADVAVIVITRASYENSDMENEIGDYILSETETDMIKNVCSVYDDVILVLHIGCSIDFGFLDDYKINGIIYLNHPGVNGNLALADIMSGDINPSGKLTVTLAKHFKDYPSSANFGQHGGGLLQDYKEDIYVGYRYFETFKDASKNVVFPFGYGLSYTSFSVTDKTMSEEDGNITVSCIIKNTGNVAGKQVVQIYYSTPDINDGAILSGPKKQLCSFEKTGLLKPGDLQRITIKLNRDSMASFDDTGVLGKSSVWVMEKGKYKIMLGTDVKNTETVGIYIEPETRIVESNCRPIVTSLSSRLLRNGQYETLQRQEMKYDDYYGISAMGETTITASFCCNRDIESFSDCKAGDKCIYKILPGTGGDYRISILNEKHENVNRNFFDFYVDDVKIESIKSSDDFVELALPLQRCEITIVPLKNGIKADEIVFYKTEAKSLIEPNELNSIEAANTYESDFRVTAANYSDDGHGNSGSYITNFAYAGRSATYKLEVKEAGIYAIGFKYAYCGEDRPINTVMTVLASNIVKPLGGGLLKKTYNKDENITFERSGNFNIELPSGNVYLKIAAEAIPFPDISIIYLEKIKAKITEYDIAEEDIKRRNSEIDEIPRQKLIDSPDNYPKIGIQFKDVYFNPQLMDSFLEQLSNRELATIVSGTSNNLTPGGDVGCNSPLHERGVPAAQTADGPFGLRQYDQIPVAFPVGMVLTATFNKELYNQYGICMAYECLEYGVDYLLGPSINIIRNPAGGRNCSYASEDPYLAGIMAANYIKGVQSKGVATVLKHYTANSTEFERQKSNSRVSGRALREIYLKAFEIACKNANPWCMMSSYNYVNNKKVCEDYTLITDIPRNEWHWDGIFMTDWWNDSSHIEELKAGHDLKMSTGDIEGVTDALDSGELTREQVYVCARRVLKTLMKIGRIKKQLECGEE